MAAWTIRAKSTADDGAPRTNTRPSSISRSSGAASSSAPAAARTFARTWPAASAIELPAVTPLRLANVPMPNGTPAVSPPVTVTQSSGTPSASAATCANDVSWPWPEHTAPVATCTRPAASSVTRAPSNGPMAVPST